VSSKRDNASNHRHSIDQRVAIITGSTGGVGGAVAEELGRSGYRLLLSGRNESRLASLATAFRASGIAVEVEVGPLEGPADALRIAAAARTLGSPSILVNASGMFGPVGTPPTISLDEFVETFAVNFTGPMTLTLNLLQDMLDQGWGRLINVSSAQSLHDPDPIVAAYASSKTALNYATRCVAAGLEGSDVAACVIHPGNLKTSMWSDIHRRAAVAGEPAAHLQQWARRLQDDGGDDPRASALLVIDIVTRDATWSNGKFLTIDGGFATHPPVPW